MTFVIRNTTDAEKAGARLLKAFDDQGRKPLEVVLRIYRPRRSVDQNSLLWVTHDAVAKRLNDLQAEALENSDLSPEVLSALRHPWSKDACHELIFKPRFCGGRSSTKMDKMEMVDALTEYQAWAGSIGVHFDGEYNEQ